LELDLVYVEGRRLDVGAALEEVKLVWREHADLDLPWHYFAKQTGHLEIAVGNLQMMRCPLTWSELAVVAPETVSRRKRDELGWDHPANELGFEEAADAARRLADHHGIGLRLPTEFEWEHVARGREDRRYPWGDEFDPSCANLVEAGLGATEPVGSRTGGASEAGVLDLAGNVDEWTATIYEPLPGAHWTVPRHETWAADPHVTRGGSFDHHRDLALARRRHGLYRPWVGAGVRLVVDAS
jgi:formylglycine-generating enzyme required for sulfatase activity